jgi:hypothetical protein
MVRSHASAPSPLPDYANSSRGGIFPPAYFLDIMIAFEAGWRHWMATGEVTNVMRPSRDGGAS